MADSDSLPLQGPSRPAPEPRAHDGPPPSPVPAGLGQLSTAWTAPTLGLPQTGTHNAEPSDIPRPVAPESALPGYVEAPPLPTVRPTLSAQPLTLTAASQTGNGAGIAVSVGSQAGAALRSSVS